MGNDYVLDITLSTPCFCPYENGQVITGLSIIGGMPKDGNFVGIFHEDGVAHIEDWIKNNPKWKEEYLAETE